MKKNALLHGELSKTIALLAHDDTILIGDAGMPVPVGVKLIDLAVTNGVPPFLDVLKAIIAEMQVAEAYIDEEQPLVSPEMYRSLRDTVCDDFPLIEYPHCEIKKMSENAKAVIRTGEFTPYANIILKADVLF